MASEIPTIEEMINDEVIKQFGNTHTLAETEIDQLLGSFEPVWSKFEKRPETTDVSAA